jgi:tetratricopeptide (TPR) repeat protein
MGMISLLFIVFRRFFLGFSDFHGLASSVNYLGTIASSSFAYLRIGLFPYDLHFERFVPVFHDLFPAFAYLILFFLCIGLFLKKSYRNGRLMFAFSGLFVLFVPVSNIMPFYGKLYVFMADHFLYLPLMFLLIMAACFYEDNSRKIRNFVSAGAAALFIFNIYFFFHYAPLWSDKESFYKQIAGRSAFPLRAYNNLAELYLQKGDPRCLQYLEKVRQIMPDRYVFYYLTKTKWHYFQEKDLDKTISTFHEAIRDGIRNPVIYFAMGDAYEEKGDLARAALSYESAYNLGDRNPYRLIKLSMFYKAIGTEMALEKADFFSREAALIWSQKEGSMNE